MTVPMRRHTLLALVERLAANLRSQRRARQAERLRWRQLSRGSPDVPSYLRADVGLPPLADLPPQRFW